MDAARDRRAFRRVLGAHAVSVIGDFFVPVAIAFAVLGLTGSPSDLGLVLAARTLPQIGFVLFGGVIGDRVPRLKVMIGAHVVRCVSQGAMAAVLIGGVAETWQLMALQVVHGVASASYRPAATALLPEVVAAAELQRANAALSVATSAAMVLGPALAGVVVTASDPGWAIALDAASFGVAAALLTAVPGNAAAHGERSSASVRQQLVEGFAELRTRDWLWTSIVGHATLQVAVYGSVQVLGPIVANDSLGGAGAWSAVLAAGGAGSVIGGVFALRLQPRQPLFAGYALTACVCCLTPLLLAFAAPLVLLAAAQLAYGLGLTFFGAQWDSVLQHHVPGPLLGRVAAYDWLGSSALRPLGLALAGPLAAATSVEAVLLAAAFVAVATDVSLLAIPGIRRLRIAG